MPEDKKLVFDAEYEEKSIEKPKPVVETKTLQKPKPKPKVEKKISKVDLKKTLEKCDRMFALVFTMSGQNRWGEARQVLADIKKDIKDKLKE